MKCPICKKEVTLESPEMPFCSERCRLIDLGMWANEEYRIPVAGTGQAVPTVPTVEGTEGTVQAVPLEEEE